MRNRRAGLLAKESCQGILLRVPAKGSCEGVTSTMLSAPDIDRPFGEVPLVRSLAGEKAVREVSAYSTVFPEFAWEGWN